MSSTPDWADALPQAVLIYQIEETELGKVAIVTGMNRKASELWGISGKRAYGRPMLEIVRRHTLEQLAEAGGRLEIDVGGETWDCMAIRNERGGSLILENISSYRHRESELREATAILSHEFRTPVTAIRGILEALECNPSPELQKKFLSQGLQEIERLTRLIDELAIGFRPTRARALALAESFERVEHLIASSYTQIDAKQIKFGQSYFVRADPDKLLQVLLNLIENAIKYGPSNDSIHITTTSRGNNIEIAVLDYGQPIINHQNSSFDASLDIFKAHIRGANAKGSGSGMGLYIVRSIVEGWGGKVWLERRSHSNRLANAFCFTIPAIVE